MHIHTKGSKLKLRLFPSPVRGIWGHIGAGEGRIIHNSHKPISHRLRQHSFPGHPNYKLYQRGFEYTFELERKNKKRANTFNLWFLRTFTLWIPQEITGNMPNTRREKGERKKKKVFPRFHATKRNFKITFLSMLSWYPNSSRLKSKPHIVTKHCKITECSRNKNPTDLDAKHQKKNIRRHLKDNRSRYKISICHRQKGTKPIALFRLCPKRPLGRTGKRSLASCQAIFWFFFSNLDTVFFCFVFEEKKRKTLHQRQCRNGDRPRFLQGPKPRSEKSQGEPLIETTKVKLNPYWCPPPPMKCASPTDVPPLWNVPAPPPPAWCMAAAKLACQISSRSLCSRFASGVSDNSKVPHNNSQFNNVSRHC